MQRYTSKFCEVKTFSSYLHEDAVCQVFACHQVHANHTLALTSELPLPLLC